LGPSSKTSKNTKFIPQSLYFSDDTFRGRPDLPVSGGDCGKDRRPFAVHRLLYGREHMHPDPAGSRTPEKSSQLSRRSTPQQPSITRPSHGLRFDRLKNDPWSLPKTAPNKHIVNHKFTKKNKEKKALVPSPGELQTMNAASQGS